MCACGVTTKIFGNLDRLFSEPILLVGVCGGSGLGKSTFVLKLINEIGPEHITLLSCDNYYLPISQQQFPRNFDHPTSIDSKLLANHLISLKNNQPIDCPVYDFVTHSRTDETIHIVPKEIVILDGILILSIPEIERLLHLKIFNDADADERFCRRQERDIKPEAEGGRGRSIEQNLDQWRTTVAPMHKEFVEPSKSKAHLIIPSRYGEGYSIVTTILSSFLNMWIQMRKLLDNHIYFDEVTIDGKKIAIVN